MNKKENKEFKVTWLMATGGDERPEPAFGNIIVTAKTFKEAETKFFKWLNEKGNSEDKKDYLDLFSIQRSNMAKWGGEMEYRYGIKPRTI